MTTSDTKPRTKLLCALETELRKQKNDEKAIQISKYLRNLFPSLGLQHPEWKKIAKEVLKDFKDLELNAIIQTVKQLYTLPEREFHHCALELLFHSKKLWRENIQAVFDCIEDLLRQNQWWDTIDNLAGKHLGTLLLENDVPDLIHRVNAWVLDENMWMRRASILYQLKWKKKTDVPSLLKNCNLLKEEDEFFIQKAIGWSLRELSKTNKKAVRDYLKIERKHLSKLAVREASKYL
eukprot:GCRY01004055.1.p1 GENE.GCRY01004055.1~~GCRY01004055.1.p1  ORF type:complete len:236 (-),score=35.39 GCRY01004055.1:268-975(-)